MAESLNFEPSALKLPLPLRKRLKVEPDCWLDYLNVTQLLKASVSDWSRNARTGSMVCGGKPVGFIRENSVSTLVKNLYWQCSCFFSTCFEGTGINFNRRHWPVLAGRSASVGRQIFAGRDTAFFEARRFRASYPTFSRCSASMAWGRLEWRCSSLETVETID